MFFLVLFFVNFWVAMALAYSLCQAIALVFFCQKRKYIKKQQQKNKTNEVSNSLLN